MLKAISSLFNTFLCLILTSNLSLAGTISFEGVEEKEDSRISATKQHFENSPMPTQQQLDVLYQQSMDQSFYYRFLSAITSIRNHETILPENSKVTIENINGKLTITDKVMRDQFSLKFDTQEGKDVLMVELKGFESNNKAAIAITYPVHLLSDIGKKYVSLTGDSEKQMKAKANMELSLANNYVAIQEMFDLHLIDTAKKLNDNEVRFAKHRMIMFLSIVPIALVVTSYSLDSTIAGVLATLSLWAIRTLIQKEVKALGKIYEQKRALVRDALMNVLKDTRSYIPLEADQEAEIIKKKLVFC